MNMRYRVSRAVLVIMVLGVAIELARGADEELIVSNRDGNAEIYLVELESKPTSGKAEKEAEKIKVDKNLTNDPGDDTYPA